LRNFPKMANLRVCLLLSIIIIGITAGLAKRPKNKGTSNHLAKKPFPRLGSHARNPNRPVALPKSKQLPKTTVSKHGKRLNLTSSKGRKQFPDNGPYSYDYLLGEDSFFDTNVDVVFVDYDIDEDVIQEWKDDGKIVICYVNVGAWEDWRTDADDFPESVLGNDYDGWEGERWLDITQHDILLPIMHQRFEQAAQKGCEGIDPDNMNGYSVDTGFDLSYDDQLEYNMETSWAIQGLGMLAGMKNDNEQAADLVWDMDFAVLEQCAAYDECHYFDTFIEEGKPVFAIEYTDAYDENDFLVEVCPLQDRTGMSFILKDYDLHGDFIVTCRL